MVSHETIRQLILRLGEFLEKEEAGKREDPEGKRRVPVLFAEADGYWVSMQREKDREVRMKVSHEGWRPRTPGSAQYELVNKSHYLEPDIQSEDFWDNASRHLCSIYDIDQKTLVVINGDQAKWIRKGVEYFPKAIYQVDRSCHPRDARGLQGLPGAACGDGLRHSRDEGNQPVGRAIQSSQAHHLTRYCHNIIPNTWGHCFSPTTA